MKAAFPLGPRILHYTDKTKAFLERIGISREPREFKIGYLINGEVTTKITKEQRLQYYMKTRGNKNINATTMSEGKTSIVGWDINEINLVDVLHKRNKHRIHQYQVTRIDPQNNLINYFIEYDKLISTIPLDALQRLIHGYFGDPHYNLKKREVYFHLCELENDIDFDYIYNIDSPDITRMTKVGNNKFVIEAISPVDHYFVIDRIAAKTQIVTEVKLENYYGIELVGRYAQYDHSVKTNNIIERYFKWIKRPV